MVLFGDDAGDVSHSLVHVFVLVTLSSFAFVFWTAVYRLTFHPLAAYPGPLLGRLTDWYSVYQAWNGKRHLNFYYLHQKYGDVVRYGPNSISFNSAIALQHIYGPKANVRKADFYSAFPASKGAWSTHSAIDKNLHARKRRVLSHGFSDAALRGLQPHILHIIRQFCDEIGKASVVSEKSKSSMEEWSSAKDMAEWTNYMSYDVLGDICYGKSFETLKMKNNRFAIDLVATSSKFHYLNGQMPSLKKLGLDRVLFPKIRADRQRFLAYSKERLAERMVIGTDTDRRDFFYYLLDAKDPETGEEFSTTELWGESNVLLIAGSDTTSTALSACFFYLLHRPSTLAHLTTSIRSTFAHLEDIVQGPQLTSLHYLRACIDEAMRLSPPVSTLLPREVLPGGLDLDGAYFPEGTVVGVPTYAIHHNEAYYPDPFSYKPERWITRDGTDDRDGIHTSEEANVALAQAAFCPFSIGSRGCIGKGVAYLELSIALARVVWLYDLRLKRGEEDVGRGEDGGYGLVDCFIAQKQGPVVEFKRRGL